MSKHIGNAVNFDTVQQAERDIITEQRKHRLPNDSNAHLDKSDHYSGIAISGGGIRSASFALGILQALNAKHVLPQIDYLSTVSGGGYIGSSWTWFNYLKRLGKLGDTGKGYFFPFGDRDEGARSEGSSIKSSILSYLRQHASYLVPGFGINYFSGFAVVFRNMLLPLLVYISMAVVLFCGIIAMEHFITQAGASIFTELSTERPAGDLLLIAPVLNDVARINISLLLALASLGLLSIIGLSYGPTSFLFARTSTTGYRVRTWFQRIMGLLVISTVAFSFIGLLPFFIEQFSDTLPTTLSGCLGVVGGVWHFIQQSKRQAGGLPTKLIAIVSAMGIIIAIAAFSYWVALHYSPNAWKVALPLALLTGTFVSLNVFGLGRMYRDRLIETFMPNADTVRAQHWAPASEAAVTELSDVNTGADQGPYHLLNTNLILTTSADNKFKGRGGDNFILSSQYCGSDATGWTETATYNQHNLTLGTAMATSGAAVNPHAGPDSQGITRNPLVSFLMFILGLRMGLYIQNPRYRSHRFQIPNYLKPGLWQGLLGQGLNEHAGSLTLSDGGHFENTATYELIRRRVKSIIISEAGQDVTFSFQDIANLIEKVRVDFGVHIKFLEDYGINHLVPGSIEDSTPFEQRYDMAKRGFAIAQIEYPDGSKGHLFIIKATLTRDLPADLYGYKDANPNFPNQTTMDQFFDEVQSESYRELGYQLAKQLCQHTDFRLAFHLTEKTET